ncbi:hypothetical protein HCN44_007292 [Aphidius gifuensis]|uniref:Ionotropic receptor n=1 Tax=Aphidius gifuensis TaxID=684658 RepID=A0A835CM69_APHGI|nr:uncharacterized protein LOC122857135 [Aphidius gifuensis]XP_044015082.1 uncharacterized protein LOC122857135 [Aphidius gifuensis]KAF7988982.1 hypothetical protein HCN44_007292 [Aphidius gifuensis]
MASVPKNNLKSKPVELEKEVKAPDTIKVEDHSSVKESFAPELLIKPVQKKKIPIIDTVAESEKPVKVPVPRKKVLDINPSFLVDSHPLVLATHLVPSLSIEIFEIIAQRLEAALNIPVVLIHESRNDRPVATDFADIAILPVNKEWKEGCLLEVGLVFEHRLNTDNKPGIYADVVVAMDRGENIEDITDLRGCSCAMADNSNVGAAGLIFKHLKTKGENPSFFGNTLYCETQVAALQMVAGKQADISVIESPVICTHKNNLPGMETLFILESLGPLPPYQIMINEKLSGKRFDEIKKCLLDGNDDKIWLENLKRYGINGFAEYSIDNYDVEEIKSVVTSVRYY